MGGTPRNLTLGGRFTAAPATKRGTKMHLYANNGLLAVVDGGHPDGPPVEGMTARVAQVGTLARIEAIGDDIVRVVVLGTRTQHAVELPKFLDCGHPKSGGELLTMAVNG